MLFSRVWNALRLTGPIISASGAALVLVTTLATPSFSAPTTVDGTSGATGQTVSISSDRPADVPANYVLTPNGYFDPSCVHEVGANQIVVPDGSADAIVTVETGTPAGQRLESARKVGANAAPGTAGSSVGAVDALTVAQIAAAPHVPTCVHPRYALDGQSVAQGAQVPGRAVTSPTVNGWVETGNTSSLGAMSYLHAVWSVPAAPATRSSQTVYFFPGFEDLSGSPIILQPVLAWNQGGSGISGWSAASWNCCSIGNTYHSSYIRVTGSTVSGDISGNGCSTSTGVCSTWAIVTYDWGSEASTTYNTTAGGRAMKWVLGGVLEAYNVTSCAQYTGTSVRFHDFYLEDVKNYIKTPSWNSQVYSGLSPSCGYGVGIGSDRSITLRY